MRNRRLSKEIRLLIFRFRRRGATKVKQSVPARIIRWLFFNTENVSKSRNAILSVERHCFAKLNQFAELPCGFRDISSLFLLLIKNMTPAFCHCLEVMHFVGRKKVKS